MPRRSPWLIRLARSSNLSAIAGLLSDALDGRGDDVMRSLCTPLTRAEQGVVNERKHPLALSFHGCLDALFYSLADQLHRHRVFCSAVGTRAHLVVSFSASRAPATYPARPNS